MTSGATSEVRAGPLGLEGQIEALDPQTLVYSVRITSTYTEAQKKENVTGILCFFEIICKKRRGGLALVRGTIHGATRTASPSATAVSLSGSLSVILQPTVRLRIWSAGMEQGLRGDR